MMEMTRRFAAEPSDRGEHPHRHDHQQSQDDQHGVGGSHGAVPAVAAGAREGQCGLEKQGMIIRRGGERFLRGSRSGRVDSSQ